MLVYIHVNINLIRAIVVEDIKRRGPQQVGLSEIVMVYLKNIFGSKSIYISHKTRIKATELFSFYSV